MDRGLKGSQRGTSEENESKVRIFGTGKTSSMGEKTGNIFSELEERAGGKRYRPDWARLEREPWLVE